MKEEKKEYFFEYNMSFMLTLSVIISVIVLIFGILLYNKIYNTSLLNEIYGMSYDESLTTYYLKLVTFIISMIVWMVIHEIIHGLFYRLGGAKKESITYGAVLEKGIFFCRCGEYVNKKTILTSLMAPFTIIGIITLIIGYLIQSWLLVILSLTNIGGAAADLAMFFFFILKTDKDILFREYGDSTIFSLKTKKDLSKEKFLSVKLTNKDKAKEEKDIPKLTITKASKIFLLITLIILILMYSLVFIN